MNAKLWGKRLCSLFLCLLMLTPAALAAGVRQDRTPIFSGDVFVDYMAEVILKSIPTGGKTDAQKIAAVYDWIIRNCKREGEYGDPYFDIDYLNAHGEEWADLYNSLYAQGKIRMHYDMYVNAFASDMALYRMGNCAHYSALLNVLLEHLGYETYLIAGEFINSDGSHVMHKWNLVLVDDQFYWLDVRMDHASYARTGSISHTYFMKTDTAQWAKRHEWDQAGYDQSIGISATQAEYRRIANGAAAAAVPNLSPIYVDGAPAMLGAFTIGGSNYFKLRDVALLLSQQSSPYRFSVDYDALSSTVSLTRGAEYAPQGSEFRDAGLRVRACTQTTTPILVDGEQCRPAAYQIAGSNYFKLRDLADIFGFGVDWDEQSRSILITTR